MPKGVMLSHNNITTVMKASGKFVSGDDKFFGLMPFHHAFGLILMLYGLCEGSQVITMAKLKWEAFVNALSDYQVTVLFLVPSLLVSLGKHEGVTAERMKSVRRIFSGASQINPKYQEIMSNCFPHIELYHSYGMTETCFVTYCGKYRPDKPGSCGLLVDTIKCKVIDANGDEVKANEMGEFCFKGPTVMKGYLNNDEATRESIDENGWLHSGDIGYFDEDGYYFVKERIKEIIKYQGHQISPSEIESVLMLHKGVTDAAVVGVPDPHYGELPRAYVVKTDSNITEEELVKFINGKF
ncbi:hypothetical protein AAG570_004091 [Ranatra chinensis]|uniref:Luciferase n=1 Tax=Ranatra chinensis TaxID=642074 RepID=A0ABD0Y2U5_9HEMI